MLLLVLALWKRGGVTAWMSVRSIGAFARDTYATARENVATRVFFRSWKTSRRDGARVGARGERAFSEDAPR